MLRFFGRQEGESFGQNGGALSIPKFSRKFPFMLGDKNFSEMDDLMRDRFLVAYAQGAGAESISQVAEFLAPTVPVIKELGYYTEWDRKTRWVVPDVQRALGGDALQIGLHGIRRSYDCRPNALDARLDTCEGAIELALAYMDSVDMAVDLASLTHEKVVIMAALGAAGAGTDVVFGANDDPVKHIDGLILALIKAAYSQEIGVLFGANAWDGFKSHPAVQKRCPAGVGYYSTPQLFHTDAPYLPCYSFYDANPIGQAADVQFMMSDEILIFARSSTPTRRDPSFMKTFRLHSELMGSRKVESVDGRGVISKFDWSEDVRVTNADAVVRLNATFG